MNPIEQGLNKTTTFLLPMLFPNTTYNEIFANYLKQAYVGLLDDENDPSYTIVLEFDENNVDVNFIEDLLTNIDLDGKAVASSDSIIEIKVTDTENYDAFIKGQYSKFTPEYKTTILEFWKVDEKSLISGILMNDQEVVTEKSSYLSREIVQELGEAHGESWPPPNLFVDELYLA